MGPDLQRCRVVVVFSTPHTCTFRQRTGEVHYVNPAHRWVSSVRTLSLSTSHDGSKKLSCSVFLRPIHPFRRRGPGRPHKPVDRPACGTPKPQGACFRVAYLVVERCPKRIVAGRWRQSPALGHMQFIHSMLGSSSKQSGEASTSVPNNGTHTGGDVRHDGKVSFGYSLMRGKRASMEDYFHAQFKKLPSNGLVVGCFGVFDGHGGPNAADFVRSNLFDLLLNNQKFTTDRQQAIVEAFVETDQRYLQHDSGSNRDDGCTAVAAVLVDNHLLVANVGDSRAVLSRNGKALPLSVDHKPNRQDERTRIENAGGVVVWAGTWRVGGVLAVSRAFGDRLLKRYVVATPDITEETVGPDDQLVVLASDGLWDVVSNDDAINLIKDIKDAQTAAKKLTDEAYNRGSCDNISCIVIRFNH